MAEWHGTVEFDFVGEGEGGNFVATTQVLPMLTQLLASGQVEEAVRLYEGADAAVGRELVAGLKLMSSASQRNLGQMFVLARDFASAAQIFEVARRPADAAKMYEQGGDFPAAARCWEASGDPAKAAAAKERAGDIDGACVLYAKAGSQEALAGCLTRAQRFYEAAQVYQKLGNARGEVEMLRMVPTSDAHRLDAVKRLADLFGRYERLQASVQMLMETVQLIPEARKDQELLGILVRQLDTIGRPDAAARVRALMNDQPSFQVTAPQGQLPERAGQGAVLPRPAVTPTVEPSAPAPARPVTASSADPFADLIDPFSGRKAETSDGTGRAAPSSALDPYTQLKGIPIFGQLALPDMKDLFRVCGAMQWPAGAVVIEQGAPGKGLIVITEGQVQVVRVDKGATKVLATLSAGAYVGEISLVDDAPTSARVVASGPVRGLVISPEKFEQYLYTHEAAALQIYTLFTRTLATRLRQANER